MQPFGLESVSLKDYLKSSSDTNYLLACANYYLDLNDYPNSFVFIEFLRKRFYSAPGAAAIQQALAAKVAPVDYANNPKKKVSVMVNAYTGGNAWYAAFKKAYINAWKALRKKNPANDSRFMRLVHKVTAVFGG